jgi:hypothetical protein
VDLPRSRALWNDIFEGPQALIKKGGWPDRASVGIPALYVNSGLILSESLENIGDRAGAAAVMQRTGIRRARSTSSSASSPCGGFRSIAIRRRVASAIESSARRETRGGNANFPIRSLA